MNPVGWIGRTLLFGLVLVSCARSDTNTVDAVGLDSASQTSTSDPSDPEDSPVESRALEWSVDVLGPVPIGAIGVGTTPEGNALVLASSREAGLVWVDENGRFRDGRVEGSPPEDSGWLDPVAFGLEMATATGDQETFLPQIWRSQNDGREWQMVSTIGLDRPGDVAGLYASDDRVVMVGSLRVGAEPGNGPFRPAIWISDDLTTWTLIELGIDTDGWVGSIVGTREGLVASGSVNYSAAAWLSVDGGQTWARDDSTVDTNVPLTLLASGGESFVGVGQGIGDEPSAPTVVVSHDGGSTWSSGPLTPTVGSGIEHAWELSFASGSFWIVGARVYEPRSEECYRDVTSCQGGSASVLLRSEDGDNWHEVDTTTMQINPYFQLLSVVERGEGVAVIIRDEAGLAAWTWASATSPPVVLPPETSNEPLPELATFGATIELGKTYRFPLYLHCGIGYLGRFNQKRWYQAETSPQVEVDQTWPIVHQFVLGTITLIDDNTIEYRLLSGEAIATYHSSDVEPPGCD